MSQQLGITGDECVALLKKHGASKAERAFLESLSLYHHRSFMFGNIKLGFENNKTGRKSKLCVVSLCFAIIA